MITSVESINNYLAGTNLRIRIVNHNNYGYDSGNYLYIDNRATGEERRMKLPYQLDEDHFTSILRMMVELDLIK